MTPQTAINQIKIGLNIGKEKQLIDWGKLLSELVNDAEASYTDENGQQHLNFGMKEVFPDIILGLYAPFDTCRDNFSNAKLNHVGQNLNLNDIEPLIEKLTGVFGNPTERDDSYGIYCKWGIGDITIEIIPRSHHGSDWGAILIKSESYCK